ncbi:hypothetical protein WICPIJ_006183 [Wickerhamomyces pijperi]|uniref:RNase III domain-containing protein n=1 Tax=Wickerhamomyces pijperi TaxID=599730 RepID=A0A9P8Q4W1_WICPI|nr:hypothetical protein WICPIJ_006183 [Wickerhamomyces pijperi]
MSYHRSNYNNYSQGAAGYRPRNNNSYNPDQRNNNYYPPSNNNQSQQSPYNSQASYNNYSSGNGYSNNAYQNSNTPAPASYKPSGFQRDSSSYAQSTGRNDNQGYVKSEYSSTAIPPANVTAPQTTDYIPANGSAYNATLGSYTAYNQNAGGASDNPYAQTAYSTSNYSQPNQRASASQVDSSNIAYVPSTVTATAYGAGSTSSYMPVPPPVQQTTTTATTTAAAPVTGTGTATSGTYQAQNSVGSSANQYSSFRPQAQPSKSTIAPPPPPQQSSTINVPQLTASYSSSSVSSSGANGRYHNSSRSYCNNSGNSGRYPPTPGSSSSTSAHHQYNSNNIHDNSSKRNTSNTHSSNLQRFAKNRPELPHGSMQITATPVVKNDPNSHSAWILTRLMHLKREGVTFKTVFGNIVDLGFDKEELNQLLAIDGVPQAVAKLAKDENVQLSIEIKEKFSDLLECIKNGGKPVVKEDAELSQQSEIEDESGSNSKKRPLEDDDKEDENDDPETAKQKKKRRLERIPYPPPLPAFNTSDLEDTVFKHKTITGPSKQNDRFLFKGDGLVRRLCMEICFERYSECSLADLKLLQSLVVDDETLADWAYSYKFQDDYRHDVSFTGEDRSLTVSKLFADLFKTYVGALFFDYNGDLPKFKVWLESLIYHRLNSIDTHNELDKARDKAKIMKVKSEHGNNISIPAVSATRTKPVVSSTSEMNGTSTASDLHSRVYPAYGVEYPVLERSGADNSPMFRVGCVINGEIIGIASYSNIKTARQLAAKDAYESNTSKVKKYISLNDEYKRTKRTFVLPPAVTIPIEDQIPLMYGDLSVFDNYN